MNFINVKVTEMDYRLYVRSVTMHEYFPGYMKTQSTQKDPHYMLRNGSRITPVIGMTGIMDIRN